MFEFCRRLTGRLTLSLKQLLQAEPKSLFYALMESSSRRFSAPFVLLSPTYTEAGTSRRSK